MKEATLDNNHLPPLSRPTDGVLTWKGERYLTIERAAEYISRSTPALFVLLRKHKVKRYVFPLTGKLTFVRLKDLEEMMHTPEEVA